MDLGDTEGTIALRVPDHELARDILRRTGPMAVSSANISGQPAALTCDEAIEQLGDSVSVYLDGGPLGGRVVHRRPSSTSLGTKTVRYCDEVPSAWRRCARPLPSLRDLTGDAQILRMALRQTQDLTVRTQASVMTAQSPLQGAECASTF